MSDPRSLDEPLLLLVGDDALTEAVCAELTATAGHRVCVVSALTPERANAFRRLGASVAGVYPDSDATLHDVGIMEARSLLALSADDGLNLAIALRARSLNPNIRLVIRQFSVSLGSKLEHLLLDCTTLSLAVHSAATYAAAALDPACFFALHFPDAKGPLFGFSRRNARAAGVAGMTVGQAEDALRARILALDDVRDPASGTVIGRNDALVVFGAATVRAHTPAVAPRSSDPRVPLRALVTRLTTGFVRANPILRAFAIAGVIFFAASFCFFHFALGKTLTASAFYVVETMTNVGFGEVDVTKRGPVVTAGAITAMLGGIIFTSIFIGAVASALTRAQWIATQGLRRIRARGHVVVCGGGRIGTSVLDSVTAMGKRVIVIDPQPDADLVRRARDRDVDLLTGDASSDAALDRCDLENATAVLALTNSDTVNLEIALGVRVRSRDVPIVVRMEDAAFARATAQLLDITTFSPSALTAPAFAGLSRFPGTRGRVRFADEDFTIGQRAQGPIAERPPAEECAPLCVARDGRVILIRSFADMQPYDTVLFTVPLGQFRPKPMSASPSNGKG